MNENLQIKVILLSSCNHMLKSQKYCKILTIFFLDGVLGRLAFYKAMCLDEKISDTNFLPQLVCTFGNQQSCQMELWVTQTFFLQHATPEWPNVFLFQKATKMRKIDFQTEKNSECLGKRRQSKYCTPSLLSVPSYTLLQPVKWLWQKTLYSPL